MEAVWEEMQVEENGLGIIPYVMTTAGLIGEMEWEAAEVKRAVREFLADPRDSNSVTLVDFTAMMGRGGQPDMPNSRQRVAWPALEEEEREELNVRW